MHEAHDEKLASRVLGGLHRQFRPSLRNSCGEVEGIVNCISAHLRSNDPFASGMDTARLLVESRSDTADRLVRTGIPQSRMMPYTLRAGKEVEMAHVNTVEVAILQDLERRGPCTIDELAQRLPDFSWNQIFTSVDQQSRRGRLTLHHPSTFQYLVRLSRQ